jgi:hypothetical protein
MQSTDAHGGRDVDARFSSIPVPHRRLMGDLAARIDSRPHDGRNSLVAAKKAGNFAESTLFCENLSRKHQQIQVFADEFPTLTEQGIFLPAQGINSREQG